MFLNKNINNSFAQTGDTSQFSITSGFLGFVAGGPGAPIPSGPDPKIDSPANPKGSAKNPIDMGSATVTVADTDDFRESEEQKASTLIGTAGVGTTLAKQAVGVATIGTNLKIYQSGWRGGSRARIKTYSLAEGADFMGTSLVWIGIIVDGYSWYHGDISGFELSANSAVGLAGIAEPAIPIIYTGYRWMDDNGRAPKDNPARYVRGVGYR